MSETTPGDDREVFDARVAEERARAVAKGYTAEHDAEHGVDHLLEWATEYLRKGEPYAAAGLIAAAREALRSPAVQVDAEKVRAAVGEVAKYGGMSALDDEQLEAVIDGITDGVVAALRSHAGDRR